MKFYPGVKRVTDFILSFMAMVILSPLFLILAAYIKLDSKGPVIFKQKRIGKNKKTFYILKFRTMRIETPQNKPTHMLKNPDMFITKGGGFLRKTSLDELPQIINILKGEMSIVGPRPALWNQYDLIEERDKYGANDIIPGLTGWAQVNGRDELEIKDKARFDGIYAYERGIAFDIKIFLMTIAYVLKPNGIKEGKSKVPKNNSVSR